MESFNSELKELDIQGASEADLMKYFNRIIGMAIKEERGEDISDEMNTLLNNMITNLKHDN